MRAAMRAVLDGKQVAVLAPTTILAFQHWKTFRKRFAPFPVTVEMVSRFRTAKEIKAILARLAEGRGGHPDRHPPPPLEGRGLPRPRAPRGRRGAALRGGGQGAAQAPQDHRGRPHPLRHPDPAHPADGPRRHPRHVGHRDPAQGPPRHPDLDRQVLDRRHRGGDPAGAGAGGAGLLRAQPGGVHLLPGQPRAAAGPGGAGGGGPRADAGGRARGGHARLRGGAGGRAGGDHDRRERPRHPAGQHARRQPGRPLRPRPALPAAGAGGALRPPRLRLPPRAPGHRPLRDRQKAPRRHPRVLRPRRRLPHRRPRPRAARRGQPPRRPAERPHPGRGPRPLREAARAGDPRAQGRAAPGGAHGPSSTCASRCASLPTTCPRPTRGSRSTSGRARSARRRSSRRCARRSRDRYGPLPPRWRAFCATRPCACARRPSPCTQVDLAASALVLRVDAATPLATEALVRLVQTRPGASLQPAGLRWPLEGDEGALEGLASLLDRLRAAL